MNQTRALMAAVVVVAAALRVVAASSELWIDELWSLWTVQRLRSAADLVTGPLTRNSHALYSLFLMSLGGRVPEVLLRAPSIVAGSASPLLAYAALRPLDTRAAKLAAVVIAVSSVQVLYGSEARGYGLCVLMMLTALWLVVRSGGGGHDESPWSSAAFAVVCILGVLAHLQFIAFQAAMFVGFTFVSNANDRRSQLRLQLSAAIVCGVIVLQQLRVLEWVPGPPSSWRRVLVSAFALATGGSGGEVGTAIFAMISVASAAAGIAVLRQRGCAMWPPAALIAFAVPVLLVLLDRDQLAERFLLLPIVGVQLLFAVSVSELLGRTGLARVAGFALLALFVAGTAADLVDFFRLGRGDVRGAVAFIESRSNGPTIRVGSDQDFPAALSLSYYRSNAQRIRFVPHDAWSSEPVDWLLIWRSSNAYQREGGSASSTFAHEDLAALAAATPPTTLSDPAGRRFLFERSFPAHRISGLDLFVYRRIQ